MSGLASDSRAKFTIDFPFLGDESDWLIPFNLRESCFMGAEGLKAELFADGSVEINRLLLGEVGVGGFLTGPLGLEADFWDEELGKVGERTAADIGLGLDTFSTGVDGGKTATVMNVSTSREFMILSKAA